MKPLGGWCVAGQGGITGANRQGQTDRHAGPDPPPAPRHDLILGLNAMSCPKP